MSWTSGKPLEDAQSYYSEEKYVEEMHECAFSEDYYEEHEMVFDGCEWIAKKFLDKWFDYIESSLDLNEFEEYKYKLSKQL